MDEEGMTEAPNKLIHIGHPIDVDEDRLYYALRVMKEAAANETDDMRLLMQSIVSTYHIKTEENQQCENLRKLLKLKKRTDKILSGAGLVVLSPIFAGIAIAIKLEDGITAPVFLSKSV